MNKMSSRAATQLHEIILLLPNESKSKIPLSIINLLENKKIDTEEINIKSAEHINDSAILDETKKYLSYIFLNYLATEDEKKEFNHILNENELRHQIFLRNKYDIANIFGVEEKKNNTLEIEEISVETQEEEVKTLIKYEEKKWWNKIYLFLVDKVKKLC